MRTSLRACVTTVTVIGVAVAALLASAAVAQADYTVNSCGANFNENIFSAALPPGGSVGSEGSACPAGSSGGFWLSSSDTISASDGRRGAWEADAPAGLEIVAASSPDLDVDNINNGISSWGGGVYWAGGGQELTPEVDGAGSWSGFASPYFGFQIICGATSCQPEQNAVLHVYAVSLSVRETTGPSLSAPDGLWQTTGWVRGQWPLNFSGSSPSGMCGLNGTIDQVPIPNPTSSAQDVAAWQQCAAPPVSTNINTASYGQGPMPLYIAGYDAAGETVGYTKTIYVDNSTPTLSLSGPTDAASTAGTQYVTATGGGSPSGIDGVACSVDDSPAHWYPGASGQVPVSGLGSHTVSCNAYDNAVNTNGVHGESQTETWSLKIGAPTVMGVGFAKYVGLNCHVVKKHETVPGHWVTRTRHGKKVKVKTRTRHKIVKVTKCHPRTIRERVVVRVPVRRHGKLVRRHGKIVYRRKVEYKRVAVIPHWKTNAKERVSFGHTTTVSGWLGLADGAALGGRTVDVLTAPENGLGQFSVAAAATTAADGTWTAALPRGPSRIVEASYGGDPDTEATSSGQVTIVVHSKIKLTSVSPSKVAWGHSVQIKGRLFGGYLPAGGVNVRLRIGLGSDRVTYGVQEHVSGDGRFTTTYTFGAGEASIYRRYWFQIATLPSGNYPYTPSSSNRINVTVGGHPAGPKRRRDKRKRRRHR
jgi:hypothetical protein